jgi:hypothetical protein
MTNKPSALAQIQGLRERYPQPEFRQLLDEVLAILEAAPRAEPSTPCDHQWVVHIIQESDGFEKPGRTTCRKCGAVGAEVIVRGGPT